MPLRQLLLLRHAKSSWDDRSLPDQDRPLSGRGRRAAAAMRRAMHALGLAPDLVLVSPARRTRETLEALEPWDDAPLIEPVEGLYLATAPQMLAVLRDVAQTVRSVLLIGHNPGLHGLAVQLIDPKGLATAGPTVRHAAEQLTSGYPTGALAEFSVPGPWRHLDTGGAQLVRFLRPRDLPQEDADAATDR